MQFKTLSCSQGESGLKLEEPMSLEAPSVAGNVVYILETYSPISEEPCVVISIQIWAHLFLACKN